MAVYSRQVSQTKVVRVMPNNLSHNIPKFLHAKNLSSRVNPRFIYDNLQDNKIRKRILEETKNLAGIYLILNKFNFDFHVGSAPTGRFYARFTNHLVKSIERGQNKVLKNAVKEQGINDFAFIIVELMDEITNKENNKRLIDLEDHYVKSLLPNYNVLTEAGMDFGYKHTAIFRSNDGKMKRDVGYRWSTEDAGEGDPRRQ